MVCSSSLSTITGWIRFLQDGHYHTEDDKKNPLSLEENIKRWARFSTYQLKKSAQDAIRDGLPAHAPEQDQDSDVHMESDDDEQEMNDGDEESVESKAEQEIDEASVASAGRERRKRVVPHLDEQRPKRVKREQDEEDSPSAASNSSPAVAAVAASSSNRSSSSSDRDVIVISDEE